jgi:hypothetical protein
MTNSLQGFFNALRFYFRKPSAEEIIDMIEEHGTLIVDGGSCDTVCLGQKAMNGPADKTIKGIYWPGTLDGMAISSGNKKALLDVATVIYAKEPQNYDHPICYSRVEYTLHR